MKERPRFEPRTGVRLAIQVLDALAEAHGKGMVHRDIKPANVLLAELPDGKRQVKLADFGLARVYRASRLSGLTLHGDMGGTPAYMAPEQITNYSGVTPAADQYSVAAMLYHMLTGFYIMDLPPMPAGLLAIMQTQPVPLLQKRSDLAPGWTGDPQGPGQGPGRAVRRRDRVPPGAGPVRPVMAVVSPSAVCRGASSLAASFPSRTSFTPKPMIAASEMKKMPNISTFAVPAIRDMPSFPGVYRTDTVSPTLRSGPGTGLVGLSGPSRPAR